MQQLTSNVFVETGIRGCNPGFVVTSEGIVLIDTPFEVSFVNKWQEELAIRGEVRYIINTESHLDHSLNNALFSGTVVAHRATRDDMIAMDLDEQKELDKLVYIDPLPIPDGYQLKVPTITFTERLTIFLGEHTFEIINLPGHTVGQTAVYIPQERVVFTGDNVFCRVQTFLGQSLPKEWMESLKILEGLDVQFIVPGHGEVTNKEYLREQRSIVRGWVDAVKKAKTCSLTIDEAVSKSIFKDPYPLDIGLNPVTLDLPRRILARLYEMVEA